MSAVPPIATQTTSPPPIIIQQHSPGPFWAHRWFVRLLLVALIFSLMYSVRLNSEYRVYFQKADGPTERYHSGDKTATDKIAVLEVSGTIMPPFTKHVLDAIKHIKDDKNTKGVLLVIDSPGGLVADSDQIYRKLVELRKTKPIYVSMKRMAASGGVYVAMGCGEEGKIFAEPTTWTGSIGVIIPRYDASELAGKVGLKTDSLKTGEFKDSLDPLRALTERDRALWGAILDDSLQRFIKIVDENRKELDEAKVKELATGQIFTADQAKAHGLIDEIGDEEVALEALKTKLGLSKARVIEFSFPISLMDLLLGSVQAREPETQFRKLLEMSVPRAMYFFGSTPSLVPLWQSAIESH
ncbi:MAG: signal peptide peptidase SppA [Planctomycetaceae bacterium]|nr:signal peptide peptidase SppA [Planctomycetaceae bacterium]